MPDTKVLANKDAEQSVLGSVFYDESVIKLLLDKLKSSDFYYLRHQLIFDAMSDLFNQKMPIDSTTVIANLEDKGKLNDCGGAQYIIDLTDAVPSVSNIETYINLVKDKSIQRKVIQTCTDIIQESATDISDSKAFLDGVEKKIFEATSERRTSDMVPVRSILDSAYKNIQINSTREFGGSTGLDSGYPSINEKTLGFQKSELTILAARPSMGKTALALNIATHIAKLASRPYVAFFSLEMSLDQLALRLISSEANISQTELRTGHFSEKQPWDKIFYAIDNLKDTNLMFDDSGVVNVQDLRALCRKKKSEDKLDIVVIDYLQLLSSSSRFESRVQEVSEISRTLKEMARELNIPVLALSQLSRNVELRQDKKPTMADLRESGSIEQDADVVMFIFRESYYNKELEDKSKAQIIIAKNRNGITGDCDLLFYPETTTFNDVKEDRR